MAQFLSNVVESSFTCFRGCFFIHVARGSEKRRPVVRPVKLVAFIPDTAFSLDTCSGNKIAGVVIILHLNLFLWKAFSSIFELFCLSSTAIYRINLQVLFRIALYSHIFRRRLLINYCYFFIVIVLNKHNRWSLWLLLIVFSCNDVTFCLGGTKHVWLLLCGSSGTLSGLCCAHALLGGFPLCLYCEICLSVDRVVSLLRQLLRVIIVQWILKERRFFAQEVRCHVLAYCMFADFFFLSNYVWILGYRTKFCRISYKIRCVRSGLIKYTERAVHFRTFLFLSVTNRKLHLWSIVGLLLL